MAQKKTIHIPARTHQDLKRFAVNHSCVTLGTAIAFLLEGHDCVLDHYDEAMEDQKEP